MKIFNLILVCVLIMSIGGTAYGDIEEGAGSTSAQFLKIPQTARAAGFGNAVCSIGGTAGSLFYNPAGIGLLDCIQIEVNYLRWIDKMNYTSAGLGIPVERIGTIGIGFIGLFYGDIPVVSLDNGELVSSDSTTANDMSFILSYGRNINQIFTIGVNPKVIYQRIEEESAVSFGFDCGAMSRLLDERLSIGLVMQNIGSKLKFVEEGYSLPLGIKIGASYKAIDIIEHRILVGVEWVKVKDEKLKMRVGVEYGFSGLVYVRGGYEIGKGVSRFTIGGGIQISMKKSLGWINYAYMTHNSLGNTHMIGLTFGFNKR